MPDDAFAATLDPRQAPPGDALAPRGGGASADPLSADYQQTVNDIRGSMADRQRTLQQREQALEGPRSQAIQQLRQPVPQPPQQQQLPPTPKRNEPGADESWLAVAGVLGAIAGGLTRNHTTNALAAMTGAMEGYNEGSKQKFDQNLKLWDAESKKILETNRQANEAYTQILQSNKLALEQKSMEIQMTAAKYDDRAAMQLAQTKDFETLGRLIQQRMDKQQQLQHWDAQMRSQHEHWKQQEDQANQRNDRLSQALQMRYDPTIKAQTTIAQAEPKALASTLTKLTQQKAAISQYEQTAIKNMDYLIQLADKVDRTGVPVLERWLRGGEKAMGDNDVRAFVTQLQTVKPEVARILANPNLTGVLSDNARKEIETFMDQGMSASNVRTVVSVLKRDFNNRIQSLDAELNDVRSQLSNLKPGQPPGPLPGGTPAAGASPASPAGGDLLGTIRGKLPQGWSVEPVQ